MLIIVKPGTPSCRNDLCSQGDHRCPTPQACQVPEDDDAPRAVSLLAAWRALTPAGRFWLGYIGGIASFFALLVGVHVAARL